MKKGLGKDPWVVKWLWVVGFRGFKGLGLHFTTVRVSFRIYVSICRIFIQVAGLRLQGPRGPKPTSEPVGRLGSGFFWGGSMKSSVFHCTWHSS